MASKQQWARLWPAVKTPHEHNIRQGKWYRVVDSVKLAVVLDVEGAYVAVSPNLVELRQRKPSMFTVVARPRGAPNPARGTNADLGHVYAVCPECGTRTGLHGEPRSARCPTCGYQGDVAWWETG